MTKATGQVLSLLQSPTSFIPTSSVLRESHVNWKREVIFQLKVETISIGSPDDVKSPLSKLTRVILQKFNDRPSLTLA